MARTTDGGGDRGEEVGSWLGQALRTTMATTTYGAVITMRWSGNDNAMER